MEAGANAFMTTRGSSSPHFYESGRGGLIGGAQASHTPGWEYDSQSSQTNDLQNLYFSLISLAVGISKIEPGLVCSVSK